MDGNINTIFYAYNHYHQYYYYSMTYQINTNQMLQEISTFIINYEMCSVHTT